MNASESKQILRKLKRKYSKKDGWIVHPKIGKAKNKPEFLVERRNEENALERVIVEARKKKSLTRKDVSCLNMFARNYAGNKSYIAGKMFVVPVGAKVDKVPGDISVMFYKPSELVHSVPEYTVATQA
jgi:hypothetical protein